MLSRRIKQIQKVIVAETTALAGSTTESLREHRAGQEPRARAAGDRAPERHDRQDPAASSSRRCSYLQEPQLHPGHRRQLSPDEHHVPDAVPDLHARDHRRPVLSRSSSTRFSSSARSRSSGNIINIYRETEASLEHASRTSCRSPRSRARPIRFRLPDLTSLAIRGRDLPASIRDVTGRQRYLIRPSNGEKPSRSSGPLALARPRWSSCWCGLYHAADRIAFCTTAFRASISIWTACVNASDSSRRTRSSFQARSGRISCS